MSENSPSVLQILVLILPALAVAWALAVWLPDRSLKRGAKLLLAALLSFIGFICSTVSLMTTGWGGLDAILTGLNSINSILDFIVVLQGLAPYFVLPLLFTAPIVTGAAVLLYFGGRAVRFSRSRARVIFGCVGAGLGILLWIGAAFMCFLLVGICLESVYV